jgi:AGZA family xanthine/uracil permease-like MFS transporter
MFCLSLCEPQTFQRPLGNLASSYWPASGSLKSFAAFTLMEVRFMYRTRLLGVSSKLHFAEQISHFFQFQQRSTHFRTEILAGLTTFMTIAPFLVVNASILSEGIYLQRPGDLTGQILAAIALTGAFSTALLGVVANYPIALVPGTGLIALFVFSIVLKMQMPWPLALSAVLVQGLLLTILSLSRFRHQIIHAIPDSIKHATIVGIGLFIAYVGLSGNPAPPTLGAGVIVASEATKTMMGSLRQPATLMALLGLALVTGLTVRRVKGAVLWGVLGTSLLAWFLGIAPAPQAIFSLPQFPTDLFGKALTGWHDLTWKQGVNFAIAVFILLFVTLSDAIGSFVGLGQQAQLTNERGELPGAAPALLVSGIGNSFGALFGVPPVVPYLESAAGIAEGGRTGFTALFVAVLLLVFLIFTPLVSAVPLFAIAPVLIFVGVLMIGMVRFIDWSNLTEAIPAFLIIIMTPLTFSIADGLAIGFITYAFLKAMQGPFRAIKRTDWFLALISVIYFVVVTLGATT